MVPEIFLGRSEFNKNLQVFISFIKIIQIFIVKQVQIMTLVEEIITDPSGFPPTPKSDLHFYEIRFITTLAKKWWHLNFLDEAPLRLVCPFL